MSARDTDEGALRRAAFHSTYLKINLWVVAALFATSVVATVVDAHASSEALSFLARRFFHDVEISLPTLYNFFLIVVNFAVLAAIALDVRWTGGRDAGHWFGLALVFLLMSYDEAAQVHERTIGPMRELLPPSPFLRFAWTPLGVLFVAAFLAIYLPFLRRLPLRVARPMVLAGVLYVTGALAVETAGGWVAAHFSKNAAYFLVATIEETFEMTGMALFGYALLLHVAHREAAPFG